MASIGETIKTLRKQRKMTQSDLAGTQLTKGMLSLIENNKAKPSIDSLQYIAERLAVPMSDLIGEMDREKLRETLKQITRISDEQNRQIQPDYSEAFALFEPILRDLKQRSYEELRLEQLHLEMRGFTDKKMDLVAYEAILKKYEQMALHDNVMSGYISVMIYAYLVESHTLGIQYADEAAAYFEQYETLLSVEKQLQFYYYRMIALAMTKDRPWKQCAEKALALSREKNMYYLIDAFYRFLFIQEIIEYNEPQARRYLNKLTLFFQMTDDEQAEKALLFWQLFIPLFIHRDFETSYTILEQCKKQDEEGEVKQVVTNVASAIEAYILFHLERYEESAAVYEEIVESFYFNKHPIDLSLIFLGLTARARSHWQLGKKEAAKRDMLYVQNEIKDFPDYSYSVFFEESIDIILGGD